MPVDGHDFVLGASERREKPCRFSYTMSAMVLQTRFQAPFKVTFLAGMDCGCPRHGSPCDGRDRLLPVACARSGPPIEPSDRRRGGDPETSRRPTTGHLPRPLSTLCVEPWKGLGHKRPPPSSALAFNRISILLGRPPDPVSMKKAPTVVGSQRLEHSDISVAGGGIAPPNAPLVRICSTHHPPSLLLNPSTSSMGWARNRCSSWR